MKAHWTMRICVVAAAAFLWVASGCGSDRGSSVRADRPESVLAVAVDRGTATSDGNARRVVLSSSGKAATGWARNPSSMRPLDRLTEGQKSDVLRAAGAAMSGVRPGEYSFGSGEGDWVRVVIMTSKRNLIFDEAAKKDAPPAPPELRTIVDSMSDQARQPVESHETY